MLKLLKLVNIINLFVFFLIGYFLFLLFFSSTAKATVVDGSYKIVVPNDGNLVSGCIYAADIRINTGSNLSNAADVIVQFDPTLIEIIDSDPSNPGKQIKSGTAYQVYPVNGNIVDENAGTIRLAGVSLSSSFSGENVFGTIQFKSKPGVKNASFVIRFDGVGATLDSNIAETSTSTDVLASKIDANMTFASGVCEADTTPPNISFITPVNNQTNVPPNQNVLINLSDSLSGVDISTLEIIVNGIPYNAASPEVYISGSPNNYSVTLNPSADFPLNSPSNILVRVYDFARNLRQSSISFNYPKISNPPPVTSTKTKVDDILPPTILFINPIANKTISNDETIVFIIQDEGSGINLNTLTVYINDKKYSSSDSTLTFSGNPSQYKISITDNFNFSKFSSSYLSVFVNDNAGNSASSNIVFNIPQNVVNEYDSVSICPASSGISLLNDVTLTKQLNSLRDYIANSFTGFFKIVESEVGFLGLASILALLPILLRLIISLLYFIFGGFLWPFIATLIQSSDHKKASVIDALSKQGLIFVKITVYRKSTGDVVRKAYTDFMGKFAMTLDPGKYVFKLEKSFYKTAEFEITINEARQIDLIFELSKLNDSYFGSSMQFKFFNIDTKIIFVYLAFILSLINLLYIRSLFALSIFLIALFVVVYIAAKSFLMKN